MTISKEMETLINRAFDLGIDEIERRARKILAGHPNLVEFVMAMGGAIFTTKDNQTLGTNEREYMKPVENFINEWDHSLHLTGHPMRFTATGPVVNEW